MGDIMMMTAQIRQVMLPKHTNFEGTIFGGEILSQVDLAALEAARDVAPHRYVTKFMNEIDFVAPVFIGDTLCIETGIKKVGRTSVTVFVEVFARRRTTRRKNKVTEATVVMVAIDKDNRPMPVHEERLA